MWRDRSQQSGWWVGSGRRAGRPPAGLWAMGSSNHQCPQALVEGATGESLRPSNPSVKYSKKQERNCLMVQGGAAKTGSREIGSPRRVWGAELGGPPPGLDCRAP